MLYASFYFVSACFVCLFVPSFVCLFVSCFVLFVVCK